MTWLLYVPLPPTWHETAVHFVDTGCLFFVLWFLEQSMGYLHKIIDWLVGMVGTIVFLWGGNWIAYIILDTFYDSEVEIILKWILKK
jgi:hypothetical protein